MTLPLYMRRSPSPARDLRDSGGPHQIRNPQTGFSLGPAPTPRANQGPQGSQGVRNMNLSDAEMFCLSCPPTGLTYKEAVTLKPLLGRPVGIGVVV